MVKVWYHKAHFKTVKVRFALMSAVHAVKLNGLPSISTAMLTETGAPTGGTVGCS